MMSLLISAALGEGRRRLAASPTAALDVEVWLARVLGQPRSWLLAHGEQPLTPPQEQAWLAGLARLEHGEPLPYLLGEWEFYGLTLQVSPAVLIPRPETELLVDEAIAWLRTHGVRTHPGCRMAADVGTGSAAIPVAVATHVADVQFLAVDLSTEALAVAGANVARHQLAERISLRQNDLLAGVDTEFDVITANLPYIPTERLPGLAVSKYEPHLALDGGADGLVLIRRLIEQAGRLLKAGGLFLEELDPELGAEAQKLARQAWPQADIRILNDLTGRPRLLRVQL